MTKLGAYVTTLTCALALTLTGCGSSTDGDDTAPTPSLNTATADAAPTTAAAPVKAEPADEGETATKPSEAAADGDATFVDGVLTTPDLTIVITEHRVIPSGEKGNEYGEKPVIAFWYEITNVSGDDVTPMDFIMYFTAFQDNNPNAENELNVSSLPDDRFRDSQLETIKKGGTVENAMAYELDDTTTPVDLVASELFMDEIGTVTYNLDGSIGASSGPNTGEDVSEKPAGDASASADTAFVDGVLTTPDLTIVITEHRVIPSGEKGNEYGEKPVIAFWYEITNVSGDDVTPMDFIMYFTAFQDNNPNAENELNVSSLPDDRFRDSQLETIKKGGTVENAMAYELDDTTTPVDLVASELFMDEIGRMTYDLD